MDIQTGNHFRLERHVEQIHISVQILLFSFFTSTFNKTPNAINSHSSVKSPYRNYSLRVSIKYHIENVICMKLIIYLSFSMTSQYTATDLLKATKNLL